MQSIVKAIPLKVEFMDLFLFKILKLNGHPFFNISLDSNPSI